MTSPSSFRGLRVCAASILIASLYAQDRIVTRIESSRTVGLNRQVLRGNRAEDAGAVDAAMPMPYITLHLKPSDAQQTALDRLLREQQDATSPNYHRWLTPDEFGDRFGLTTADLGKLTDWLQSQGLAVHDVARGRHWITFSGTAGQMGRAFHMEIHRYRTATETHYANSTTIAIPDAFADVIASVRGLDDYRLQAALGKKLDFGSSGPNFTSPTTGNHFLSPDDIATIYDIKKLYAAGLDGTGQKIVVVGRATAPLSDIRAFRNRFNLPSNDPVMRLIGPDPGPGVDLGEADLDMEWSGAIARNAQIIYVYSTSVRTSAQYAVDQNLAPVITESFGACEAVTTADFRSIAQQAAAQGITWVASTGDVGAAGCERQQEYQEASRGFAVQFPASIPEITAVGGTEFDDAGGNFWARQNDANGASALGYIPEKAWNDSYLWDGLASTSGGSSIFFPKPSWQTGPGVPNDNTRHIPDLSLAASWDHVGYITYTGGGSGAYGGTSVATPQFAGMLALLNQYLSRKSGTESRLGNINPALYRLAQTTNDVFHDITTGDNIVPCAQGTSDCSAGSFGFKAGPGYDRATGLGSIDAYNFVTEWNSVGASTDTSVAATPGTTAFSSGNIQLTATVNPAAGSSNPTGNVSFILNDTPLGTATLASASASLTVDALKFAIGGNSVYAFYEGDASFNSSEGSTIVTINPPTAGSAVAPSVSPNPVYQQPPNPSGFSWFFTVTLTEEAGVATTLNGFTIDGANDLGLVTTTRIPARGTIRVAISSRNLTAPVNRVLAFTGVDDNGRTWSRQITVPFIARTVLTPSMSLLSTPAAVTQNTSADPSCQYAQQLTLSEQTGYTMQLTKFTAAGKDITGELQQIFGGTRLAPYGMLKGTLCWSSTAPRGTFSYEIDGVTADGTGSAAATLTASLTAAAPTPVTPALSAASVTMTSAPGQEATATVNLTFSPAGAPWTATVSPANVLSQWLTVSPASGNGAGQLTLKASGSALSNGVYNATLILQVANGTPQFINVPVSFVVGASSTTSIGGVTNGASFKTEAAPGMILSVFGTQLSTGVQSASSVPLPLTIQGVSATVNGVAAPLYFVSPGQLNIQIPYETGAGPAVLGVNNNGHVASFLFQVSPAAPGIFTTASGAVVPFASGKRGDTLVLFITGEGDETPFIYTGKSPFNLLSKARLPVTVTVGGVKADLFYAGIPPGLVGVTQINYTIPQSAPLGTQPVIVNVGGVNSNKANLNIVQ